MEEYEVFFEIYGKKMKTTVSAISEMMAKEIVKSKLIIHKVEKKSNDFKNIFSEIFKK